MNNQFSGPNAWGDYLTALEQATPVIEAIAVTDYYVTNIYGIRRLSQAAVLRGDNRQSPI